MRRSLVRLLALPVAAALGLASAGCNAQWSPYAARIGSGVISPTELDSALHDASSNAGFRCLLEKGSAAGYRLQGAGSDTYDSSFVAFVLTHLIQSQVAHSVVTAARLAEPAAARTMAKVQVEADFSQELTTTGCGVASTKILQQLGATLSDSFVQLQLDEDALAARAAHVGLSDAGLSAYERANPATTKESCLSGLFLKTNATGTAVARLLKGGASFSSVFARYSGGAAGNGALGCYTNGTLTSISAALEKAVAPTRTGGTVGPVSYESAFLVARVTSRPFEPAIDALSQIFSTYSSAFAAQITAGVRRSTVQVNPQYGAWAIKPASDTTALGGLVSPESGPPAELLLNSSAVKGPLRKAPASSTGSSGG